MRLTKALIFGTIQTQSRVEREYLELSPKQQSVELIKKANKVLILGHKKPDGDMIGTGLAFGEALIAQGKTAELIVTEKISDIFSFLPKIDTVKKEFQYIEGKLLRIDTTKIPITGFKYQKHDNFLDIHLNSDKNIKYEHIEIINGVPKPDLIIILDTPDVENIDSVYDKNPELFYEVPIINIDHHPGNEYFGTVNLVDLTASSTAEILVSLLEALGVKISSQEVATQLLTGIISDTQSFRSATTTPKSLTVAAQLLAAGAKQQEIISNLYNKKPMSLMKLWEEMLGNVKKDKEHNFAWTKIKLKDESLSPNEVLDAVDELLSNAPDANFVMILCEDKDKNVFGRIKGAQGFDITEISKTLNASGDTRAANFKETGTLDEIEPKVLKQIYDYWLKRGEAKPGNLWDVVDKDNLTAPETEAEIEAATEEKLSAPETEAEIQAAEEPLTSPETEAEIQAASDEDIIDNAIKSLSQNQKPAKGFTPLKDIMDKKKKDLGIEKNEDIDVFDEEED